MMGEKSFYTTKAAPITLRFGPETTLSGISGAADATTDADTHLMSAGKVAALIDAKNTATPLKTGSCASYNWSYTSGGTTTRYRMMQPWAVGSKWSGTAKGYGGSYAEMLPMYVPEDCVVKGIQYQVYNGTSSDDYLFLCFYKVAAAQGEARNMPYERAGWVVAKSPANPSSGYSYYNSVNLDAFDGTELSYNAMFNAAGNATTSLALDEGHYWCVCTSSTSSNIWGSYAGSMALCNRMLRIDVGQPGYPAMTYRINSAASSYVPDWSGGQWLTTWDDGASGKSDGTWAPPSPFDVDDDGSAGDNRLDGAFTDRYYGPNFPNVKLLCE
jgi:hypothetical protein